MTFGQTTIILIKSYFNHVCRIKMCTQVDMDNLVTAHHEMGHIEYFMQYTNLHFIYRNGANPGFHEALGDTLALAVTTPRHLQCVLGLDLKLGLDCADSSSNTTVSEMEMNFLYFMALEKVEYYRIYRNIDYDIALILSIWPDWFQNWANLVYIARYCFSKCANFA